MNTISFDNGYGTTYKFDIVDKIPEGYLVWNIDFDRLGSGYVPLCQVYEGTYDIVKSTLKAICIEDDLERAIIKKAVSHGINGDDIIARKARAILARYSE